MRTILGILGSALLVAGCGGATGGAAASGSAPALNTLASASPSPSQAAASTPAPAATQAATASAKGAFGGVVQYRLDGAAATTTIDAVADGASVSGTAVTAFFEGTHTVQVECAARSGDIWTLGGKTEKSTIHGEGPGTWSAVIVKDGTPQQIAIWLSADPSAGKDCPAFLASFDPAGFEPGTFTPVESGALVPPPHPAP